MPTPIEIRKDLGKKIKQLGNPATFSTTLDALVATNLITENTADLYRGMLAESDKEVDYAEKAEILNRLGNTMKQDLAYPIGRTLTAPIASDPEAIAVRRDSYIAAGLAWVRQNWASL